jgi:hypothetical protein
MSRDDVIEQRRVRSFIPDFAAVMQAELSQILADPQIRNSRTLTRLLEWLVGQTLIGRGDALKSYTVAVEGMGRPEDFDSQTDSYPRVQVGRLRKALENHYAQNDPLAGQCIYIPPGSYRVRLGSLDQAYPALCRPNRGNNAPKSPEDADVGRPPIVAEAVEMVPAKSEVFDHRWLVAWLLGAFAAFAILYVINDKQPKTDLARRVAASESPVLLLAPVRGGTSPGSSDLANGVYAVMADGLSRSWTARVRLDSNRPDSSAAIERPSYKVETQVSQGAAGNKMLFVRLTDESSSTVIWSSSVGISDDEPVSESIAPVISQISSPFGAIARHERRLMDGNIRPGYSCLLGYMEFLSTRDAQLLKKVLACLRVPIGARNLDAVRLSLLSFQAVDRDNLEKSRKTAIQNALAFAGQAAAIEPKQAYAQFAFARAYFIDGDCVTGGRYARSAFEGNPYDQILLAVLGNFSSACGVPEAGDMLDRAHRYRVEGESYARLSLILAALNRNDFTRISSLREPGRDYKGGTQSYHFLCETLIAAALDERDAARGNWKNFLALTGKGGDSIDKRIRQFITQDDVRAKVIRFLGERGVLT